MERSFHPGELHPTRQPVVEAEAAAAEEIARLSDEELILSVATDRMSALADWRDAEALACSWAAQSAVKARGLGDAVEEKIAAWRALDEGAEFDHIVELSRGYDADRI